MPRMNYAPAEELKVARTCQPSLHCLWKRNTHPLRSRSGGSMSGMIVLLMKWKNALPDNQKWWEHVTIVNAANEIELRTTWSRKSRSREYVSHNCVAYETETRPHWEAIVAGTCQPWYCLRWNGITHCLRVNSGENMSAMIVLLVKWKYALSESRKWREHVSRDCTAHKLETRTAWESKVEGACQPWLCYLWNGNTHPLWGRSGGSMLALIMPW